MSINTATRVAVAAAIVAGSTLAAHSITAAAADRAVDPTTLTPPPPDFFNASCTRTGGHITCDLAFVDPVSPVLEPTEIMCGDGADQFEILDTWTRSVTGKRVYTDEGLLLRRHFRDVWEGAFTNSVTGKSVSYEQRGTYLHDLAVPGDNGTGIERDTINLRFFDGGTVLIEVGRFVFDLGADELLASAGQHPFDDYFGGDTAALQPLCDALAAP